jgi:Transposase IS4
MAAPPLAVRRSDRIPAQPHRLADDQASHRYHAQELLDLRRATELSLAPDVDSDSDEETVDIDDCSSSEDEGEEKENTPLHPPWVEQTHTITLPPCIAQPASVLPRHRQHTEMGYLQCFLPPSLIDTITTNTNLYAAFKGAPPGWTTTSAEIWRFISVHIFMGIIDLPNLHMYWEEGWRQQYVVDAFSRDRFTEILRYFHIAEPTPVGVKRTVVEKIKPLYDHCLAAFPAYFTPPEMLTLDETMVRFKGRSSWKTVIKGKPTPIGYKLYTVASNGYLLSFSIYMGKGGYAVQQGVIHHTVVQMIERWRGSNRILFLDNLYTSPALCRHLLTMGIRSCGTFRPNRKHLPIGLRDAMKTLGEGETKAWQSGQLGCLVWCDKQPVLILSTHHKVDDMVAVQNNRGPSQPPVVIKPQVVLDYNVGKAGVDTVDQFRQYYAMQRKSRKDWPSLAWWLIDICIINSYTLWRLDKKADISQLDFRRTLLKQIVTSYASPSTHTHAPLPHPPITTSDGHWPKHSHKKRKCVKCTRGREGGRQSEVVCERCNVHLCLEPCFKQHHVAHDADV